ncbi:MAG: hypothetical protein GY716_01370 [bacterium]|nr:hypothetical protein [bacterium]
MGRSGDVLRPRWLEVKGAGLAALLEFSRQMITVSCTGCGYTEFYNSDVLEGTAELDSILDVIFPRRD